MKLRSLEGAWRKRALYLTTIFASLILSLTQPPVTQPLGFLAIPLTYLLFTSLREVKEALLVGWLLGFFYFAPTLLWIGEPFRIEEHLYGWMAPFAQFLLPAGLALFWMAAFAIGWCFRRAGWSGLFILPALWALAEFASGHILTGFPWAPLALGWLQTPNIQLISLLGMYGLSYLTMLAGCLAGYALLNRRKNGLLVIPIAAISLGWVWGAAHIATNEQLIDKLPSPIIRIVQPNIAQADKWRADLLNMHAKRLLTLSGESPRLGKRPDIIVWPEAASPFSLAENPDFSFAISKLLPKNGLALIGSLRANRELDGRIVYYNSLLALDANNRLLAHYDKHNLTPFGEYLPLRNLFTTLGIKAVAARGDMAFGQGAKILQIAGWPAFAPLICYEAIFPEEVGDNITRAQWILQITNDAWFGKHAGPQQHLALARLRAIEQGLALVRVGNNGISALIDPIGRVRVLLPFDKMAIEDITLYQPLPKPLYVRAGEIIWIALSLILIAAEWLTKRHQ